MAYIIPDDISETALAQEERGELATLYYLKKNLPNSYTVFHSLHWTKEGKNRQLYYGEADFVVVNTAGDILVIEQKDGALEETDAGLIKRYGDNQKDVARQIHRTITNLRNKFSDAHKGEKLNIDYLLYCPEYHVHNMRAAGLEVGRIVDAGSREALAERIMTLIPERADEGLYEPVMDFLHNRYDIYPDIHTFNELHATTFTRLSGGLVKVVNNLEMFPLRLRVNGVAGCGKSQVSRNLFEQAIAKGRQPMLICYNRPLRNKIAGTVSDGGLVETWFGLCNRFLTEQGHVFDYGRALNDPDFWQELQEKVIDSAIPDHWRFDTLIVEEGQDFEAAWFDVLQLFLKDDADILWLEDAYQNVRDVEMGFLREFVTYRAYENYRTPESIARFIQNVLPYEFDTMNTLPGLGVGVNGYERENEQVKIIGKLVQDLIRAGFKHEDIVVLTMKGVKSSVLSPVDTLGGQTVRRFTGEYDNQGEQVMTDGRIYFDSIRRFKGQQAPAVILADVEPRDDFTYQHLLFTGMTRPTLRLELVMNQASPTYQDYRDAARL